MSKGFATVIRYRQDDDQRSSRYDELLAAEMKASKTSKGVHDKKEAPTHRVADLSGVRFSQHHIHHLLNVDCSAFRILPSRSNFCPSCNEPDVLKQSWNLLHPDLAFDCTFLVKLASSLSCLLASAALVVLAPT